MLLKGLILIISNMRFVGLIEIRVFPHYGGGSSAIPTSKNFFFQFFVDKIIAVMI